MKKALLILAGNGNEKLTDGSLIDMNRLCAENDGRQMGLVCAINKNAALSISGQAKLLKMIIEKNVELVVVRTAKELCSPYDDTNIQMFLRYLAELGVSVVSLKEDLPDINYSKENDGYCVGVVYPWYEA